MKEKWETKRALKIINNNELWCFVRSIVTCYLTLLWSYDNIKRHYNVNDYYRKHQENIFRFMRFCLFLSFFLWIFIGLLFYHYSPLFFFCCNFLLSLPFIILFFFFFFCCSWHDTKYLFYWTIFKGVWNNSLC